ncbi:hypothetical protein DVH24_006960 [Malus domestica]|uniref:Uncharacterized protein n=1 Tax=Malus domestica TaxID=3750 RepID=A0A498I6M1_MALDO|nr:hypothetical protein DVH24_006960 [Malus domestica]
MHGTTKLVVHIYVQAYTFTIELQNGSLNTYKVLLTLVLSMKGMFTQNYLGGAVDLEDTFVYVFRIGTELATPILCDNKSAITKRKNHVFQNRSKHIARMHHYIRGAVKEKEVDVFNCKTEKFANIVTK